MTRKSKRQQQAAQNDAFWRQQRRVSAGIIGDRYPTVSSVTIDFEFKVYNDGLMPAEVRSFPKTPQSPALFVYDCRANDCSDGGYDLDDVINGMLADGEDRIDGDVVCRGHIDSRYRCGDSLHYEVRTEYTPGADAPPS